MISIYKELLSEVLKEKILFIGSINKSILNYEVHSDFTCDKVAYREINIYELAHMCKEWAYTKHNKSIHSFSTPCKTWTIQCKDVPNLLANTEYEAIFSACEWIMGQNK